MTEFWEVLHRECIYLWYYITVQLRQIAPYWIAGMLLGSAVSVFAKKHIEAACKKAGTGRYGVLGLIPASLLGIASPLCLYGTVPLAASFARAGLAQDFLAAFMMTSILLNPQLIVYSASLGSTALAVRIVSCFACGICAGLLVRAAAKRGHSFFRFSNFEDPKSRDTDPNLGRRFAKNLLRNLRATGPWFAFGILLATLFQRYVSPEQFAMLFGAQNEGFGVLVAATIGVPIYACGGATIPLLQSWLATGMSMGAAAAFMITGPATKITNLGALKTCLGTKGFALYACFVAVFATAAGLLTNLVLL